ncbi:unnamed protein product [Mucor hiemalis]
MKFLYILSFAALAAVAFAAPVDLANGKKVALTSLEQNQSAGDIQKRLHRKEEDEENYDDEDYYDEYEDDEYYGDTYYDDEDGEEHDDDRHNTENENEIDNDIENENETEEAPANTANNSTTKQEA